MARRTNCWNSSNPPSPYSPRGLFGNPRSFPGRSHFRRQILRAAALLLGIFCFPSLLQAQADITVDFARVTGTVNPLLLGNNVMFPSNGGMLWDVRTNDLQADAVPFVQTIAPTILRFPGGSLSDEYLWEDAIGVKTTAPVDPGATSVSLDVIPDWGSVSSALFVGNASDEWGMYGDTVRFTGIVGPRLEGVSGMLFAHAAGSEVRPGPRQGQYEWFTHQYGIDEHMRLAASLGVGTVITVNYGTGRDRSGALSVNASLSQKVKRAAAWVAYLNGDPADTRPIGMDDEGNDWKTVGHWAKKRADRGHVAPYAVRYWEIGNEIYGGWETGNTTVRRYAQDFIEFATTMRAVDPSIKVGAVSWVEPHYQGAADSGDEWATTLIQIAGDQIDFLALHPYYPAAPSSQVSYASAAWFTATMAAAQQVVSDLQEIRAVIAANSQRAGQIELAVTEYGILPFDSWDPRDYSNLAAGLYHADLLMALARHPELGVAFVNAFTLHDASTQQAAVHFAWETGSRWTRPQYHVLQLLRHHLAPTLHSTSVSGPTFSTVQMGNMRSVSAVPTLDAIASSDEAGRLTLLVLNRAQSDAVTSSIRLLGYTPYPTATVRTITGDSLAAHNEDNHSAVMLATTDVSSVADTFSYTFPAHSLTLVEFQRGKVVSVASLPATPPTANLSATPREGKAPLSVTFDGSTSTAVDPAQILEYRWNFGDGSTATGITTSHTYTKAGTYTVTLSVTDSQGLSAVASTTIKVSKTRIARRR